MLLRACALPVLAALSIAASPASAQSLDNLKYGTWGFDLAGRDTAAKPGDNFFDYANGGYLAKTQIPADLTWYGTVNILRDLSEARVHAILEDAAKTAPVAPAANNAQGKIGAAYKAFMDQKTVDALGATPMAKDLAEIRAAKDHSALAGLMGKGQSGFQFSLWQMGVGADDKDTTKYAVFMDQAGLGLPDRDYYLQPSFAEKKQAYEAYVAAMLAKIGWANPAETAKAVVAFETGVAQVSWTRVDRRDPLKVYNPMSVAEMTAQAPGFDWKAYFAAAGMSHVDRIVFASNTAMPKIAALYAQTPLETLKAYQAFHLADGAAPYLSDDFVQLRFKMYTSPLSGQPELPVRWKRGVRAASATMGEAIGEVYVAKYFPPEAKVRMTTLVENLRKAYAGRINGLTWMGPETKAKALQKLAAYDVQIGYPNKFRDYSNLAIRSDDLYGNMQRGTAFEWAHDIGKLGRPMDKTEWAMTPQTFNAYNSPNFVQIVFPAAILQAPSFDLSADDAVNYGAIGAVIGHEMGHGFDDSGRHYDAKGELVDWWTAADGQRFDASAKALGAQYSAFEVLPGLKVNGDLTMGENIADLGGILVALDAYHASLGGKLAPVIDGLTGDQRFFLGYAQYYRNKMRDDTLRSQVVSDPHAPDITRVNVVLPNVDAWYDAFGVKPGDKMYRSPEQRVRIW